MLGNRTTLCASAALALVLSATPAAAQDAPVDEQTGEDIIVTAQKREQTLIEIPQSISVVSGETLARQQATSFQDYLGLVPGLSLEQSTPGVGRLILRGINTGSVSSTVAVYVDETPFGSSSGLVNGGVLAGDFDTFDVARVEVLRGPQGTLYGASSLGGVVRFVTNAPETDRLIVRGKASVETVEGGQESYSGTGVVNVPLSDTLAVRASGYYRKIGGFVDSVGAAGSDVEDDINDARVYGGRLSVRFKPTETLSIRLGAVFQNIENDASSFIEVDPVSFDPLYGRPTKSQFIPEFTDLAYRVYNGTIDLDLGFANLVSSTSYNTFDETLLVDNSFVLGETITAIFGDPVTRPLGLYNDQETDQRKFTQEIRLSSPSSDSFEWMVGAYYTRETGLIDQLFVPFDVLADADATGLPLLGMAKLDSVYKEYAGFANATLHLTERFDLTFGGRYSHNTQHATQEIDGALVGTATYPVATSSEDVFTYSVAPRFEINDRTAVYARVASGYRPGGPNVLPPFAPPGTPLSYDSDSLVSYEAGIKMETADRTFALDVSAFYLDWQDIQLFAIVNQVGINANGGTARSQGFEFTSTFRPTVGLTLAINGAYTDAKLTDDAPDVVGGRDGDRLPYTPEWTVNLNGDYEWSMGGETNAFVGGSLRFLGKQSADFDFAYRTATGRQRMIPSYEVIDLRAGVDFGRFSVEAFAKNIGNRIGYRSASGFGTLPGGALGAGIIRPRTIGLSAGFSF